MVLIFGISAVGLLMHYNLYVLAGFHMVIQSEDTMAVKPNCETIICVQYSNTKEGKVPMT